MFKQDYIMRQIELLIQFIARLMFNTDYIEYEVRSYTTMSDADKLYCKIKGLLDTGNICGAENALFEGALYGDREHLKVGLDFYARLNEMDDSKLDAANFSREEISDGLKDFLKCFSIDIPDE